MSFVRALEVSDSLAQGGQPQQMPNQQSSERASVYDMNYEISV